MEASKNTTLIEKHIYFEVVGNSMNDDSRRSIMTGDILMVSKLPKESWISEFKKGNTLVLIDNTGSIFVKEIIKFFEDFNEITCHSWNPDSEYQDFNLKVDDIEQIYIINSRNRNLERNPRRRN